MSKDWPYAKLVKDASENGGPENYINIIKIHEYEKGFSECSEERDTKESIMRMIFMGGIIITAGVTNYLTKKKCQKTNEIKLTVTTEEAENAEENLLEEYIALTEENERLCSELGYEE